MTRALISIMAALCVVFLAFTDCHAQDNARALRLAVHPYLAASTLVEKFSPLADYLSVELGRPVVIVMAKDYTTNIDWLGQGEVDIAYMGPSSYVLLTESYGLRPLLAVLEVNGRKTFHGVIIAAAGSPIKSIKDLRGRRFAFGDPDSTMSHLVPRYMMHKEGIDVSDLAHFEFLSNHENVAMAVLAGAFEAGAVKPEAYEKFRDKGLRVVATSPEIHEHMFVARGGLDDQVVSALRVALARLASAPEGPRILESIQHGATGFGLVKDSDYDNLRQMMHALKPLGVSP